MTRAKAQEEIDDLYANGKITRDEWSKRFDELSSNAWTSQGKLQKKEKDDERNT